MNLASIRTSLLLMGTVVSTAFACWTAPAQLTADNAVNTRSTVPLEDRRYDLFIELAGRAFNGDESAMNRILEMQYLAPGLIPEWFDAVDMAIELGFTNSEVFVKSFLESRGLSEAYAYLRATPFPTAEEKIGLAKLYLHDESLIGKGNADSHGIPFDTSLAKNLISSACQNSNNSICEKGYEYSYR